MKGIDASATSLNIFGLHAFEGVVQSDEEMY